MRQRNWVLIITGVVTTLVALLFAIGRTESPRRCVRTASGPGATVADSRAARGPHRARLSLVFVLIGLTMAGSELRRRRART